MSQAVSPGDTLVMTFRTEGSAPYYVRDPNGTVEYDGHLGITKYEGDTLIIGERIDRRHHEALLRGDTVIVGLTRIPRVTEPIRGRTRVANRTDTTLSCEKGAGRRRT